jgi:hypothetical protein
MWESLIGSRKSPLKQAGIIGLGTLIALFTRRLTLEDAVQRVCERIGIKGRAIVWSHAEPCMDVDKPSQLELLRADLEAQLARLKRQSTRARSTAQKTTKTTKPRAATKAVKPKKTTSASKKAAAFKTPKAKVKAEEEI